MFRLSPLPRQSSRRDLSSDNSPVRHAAAGRGANSRAGRAFTEVVLIILVPFFCLTVWAVCDSELKKTLLAGPNKDNLLSVNPVYDAANIDEHTIVTVQGQGQLRIWDTNKSAMVGEMQSHLNEVRCVAYSAEQRLLAVGSAMGKLEVWDIEHPETPVHADDDTLLHEVSDCIFTHDGNTLLTSGEDGKLAVWNARTLERKNTLVSADAEESIRSLGISSDSKLVIAGTHSGLVQIWDLEAGRLLRTHRVATNCQRPEAAVESVTFMADGINFIAATRNDGVGIWNITTGARVQQFVGPIRGLRSAVLTSDEKTYYAGSEKGDVVTWDVSTGLRIGNPIPHAAIIRTLACRPDGKTVLTGDWNGRIQFHNEATRTLAAEVAAR